MRLGAIAADKGVCARKLFASSRPSNLPRLVEHPLRATDRIDVVDGPLRQRPDRAAQRVAERGEFVIGTRAGGLPEPSKSSPFGGGGPPQAGQRGKGVGRQAPSASLRSAPPPAGEDREPKTKKGGPKPPFP